MNATATHELTQSEKQQAHLYLKQAHDGMLGAVKGLSVSQWNFTSSNDRWSISQIVEHAIFVLERVGGPLQEILAQAPPPPDRDYKYVDAIVMHHFPTRLAKFPAPEFARPVGRFGSPLDALKPLAISYSHLHEVLDSTPDLREHAIEAAPLKAVTNGAYDLMDGYQWIMAAAAHAERHTKQILEVKAHDSFPQWEN